MRSWVRSVVPVGVLVIGFVALSGVDGSQTGAPAVAAPPGPSVPITGTTSGTTSASASGAQGGTVAVGIPTVAVVRIVGDHVVAAWTNTRAKPSGTETVHVLRDGLQVPVTPGVVRALVACVADVTTTWEPGVWVALEAC